MTSVTVDDCLDKVGNRFQLVVIASRRARQLAMGATPRVDVEGSKPTVAALKEIASGLITPDEIRSINIQTQMEAEESKPALEINLSLDD